MIATNVPHRRSLLIASVNVADKRQSPFKSFAITELTHIFLHILATRLKITQANLEKMVQKHSYKTTLAAHNQSIQLLILSYTCIYHNMWINASSSNVLSAISVTHTLTKPIQLVCVCMCM